MRALLIIPAAVVAAVSLTGPTFSGERSVLNIHSNYTAAELLSPCQEADNDARWGQAAEIECEQYIIGFVDALEATGAIGAETDVCLPEQNIADEVRWAFMRWVHGDYSRRTGMMAAEALLVTMQEAFPCS
ncbi:Rap1a/Tai family immunity protein [Ovoidimarina sediminis]|uniref:Rap1a/Tai family immunity protein n=1 Tax=Ovoidimarina sediminis TaxID=3079856 RepID=UPI002912A72B|nr:Rap1a/Tai family immunity protein [Rhodophyticola sp. MJ-SS7]MDU8946733.1 Rap1a/Tai family immunity protein [Rhodophyticola sp. MJ-SS7]